jgi:hypothetical protein
MDALDRLAPVARQLLAEVDSTLATLGAPATHPVWRALGSVAATPAAVVRSVAELRPALLRAAATGLREQAQSYAQASAPTDQYWAGAAATHFAATASALREHLAGDRPESLAGRLRDQASCLDNLADWQQALRDDVARALGTVISSRQAATLRSPPVRGGGPDALAAVLAAADIAVVLLAVVEDAVVAGREVLRTIPADELPFQPPIPSDPLAHGGTIRLA